MVYVRPCIIGVGVGMCHENPTSAGSWGGGGHHENQRPIIQQITSACDAYNGFPFSYIGPTPQNSENASRY